MNLKEAVYLLSKGESLYHPLIDKVVVLNQTKGELTDFNGSIIVYNKHHNTIIGWAIFSVPDFHTDWQLVLK